MKKRYIVFANKRRRAIRASKDYATLRGMDFKKAKDILTKDGFYEHEYGDKDNNNGYAVYRKGDKEVELTYKWEKGTRKDQYNAGKILDVYVDEDINSATKVRSRRAIKASVDDAEVDLTFIGEPSAIMDLKNAALSAGDTITRFNANTLIIHTWDYAVDEYMEYANDLGLSVDDVSYVKSAKKITCSYDADDIVMYFNGKKVFTGSVYDLTDTIEKLCKDPVTHEKFQEWCNYYGDPFDFDGTPRDTAAVFVALIEDEMDYYDGDPDHTFYASGQKGLDFEIFYADQEVGIPN